MFFGVFARRARGGGAGTTAARLSPRRWVATAVAAGLIAAPAAAVPVTGAHGSATQFATQIQHVVYIIMENHSFDNVLGPWCKAHRRCDGATTGTLDTGQAFNLLPATDHVIQEPHTIDAQTTAIDGGRMDGFSLIKGCTSADGYKCYTAYSATSTSIANVTLATASFVVSDRTFEDDTVASWGMHEEALTATLDGFVGGGTPHPGTQGVLGPGWGCNSGLDTSWVSSAGKSSKVPSCVPDLTLTATNSTCPAPCQYGGAYRATPVKHVPTMIDSLNAAGLSWKLYVGLPGSTTSGNSTGYGWAICPTFAACLYTKQHSRMVDQSTFVSDADAGTLPNFSVITPSQANSQHNGDLMSTGDSWLGSVLNAVETGPEWSSTALFLTWDDCGCFYDHVPPAPGGGRGIRVPMIIVSPYAKAGTTDSTPASYASVLAFTETVFGLPTLGAATEDVGAYNFMNSFDFAQSPLAPAQFVTHPTSPEELQAELSTPPDPDDPT